MTAPVNDNRSGALLVPSAGYWGIVLDGEINTDTTEDAGGPVDGFGARDVYYYWSSLPAGNVYIYVQPRGGNAGAYFEAGTFSGSPTSWTDVEGLSGGAGSGGASGDTCRFQHLHTGGDLTLVVYTYVGDSSGDTMTFDFGWGHELDAVPSHWSDEFENDWDFKDNSDHFGLITSTGAVGTSRGIKQTYTAPNAGLSVPAEVYGTCAFENARDGVVDTNFAATIYGCSYIGPGAAGVGDPGGAGTSLSGFSDNPQYVGSYYLATGIGSVPPSLPTTGRSDRVGVEQTTWAVQIDTSVFRGPVNEDEAFPPDFTTYRAANDGPDDALVWGYQFTEDDWETRNYALGTFTVSDDHVGTADVIDDCTVTLRLLDQSMIYGDISSVRDAPNRVWLNTGAGASILHGYIPAADVPATEIANLGDTGTVTDLVVADGSTIDSWFVTADGETGPYRFILGVMVSEQVLADTPPTFGDPPRAGQWQTIGNRAVGASGTLGFEARLPTWRAFIGFPIAAPGGWHVGRVGSGGSW